MLSQSGIPVIYSGDEVGQLNDWGYREIPQPGVIVVQLAPADAARPFAGEVIVEILLMGMLSQSGIPVIYSGDEVGQLNDWGYRESRSGSHTSAPYNRPPGPPRRRQIRR